MINRLKKLTYSVVLLQSIVFPAVVAAQFTPAELQQAQQQVASDQQRLDVIQAQLRAMTNQATPEARALSAEGAALQANIDSINQYIASYNTPTGGTNNNPSGGTNNANATLQNPLAFNSLQDLIFGAINIVLKFAYVFIAISIIWSGFKLISAQGKPEEIKKAKSSISWTLIGAAIVIGANVIASVLQNTISSLTK